MKNNDVVFTDKEFFINYIYQLLKNPTNVKLSKSLYLLYAFYGATYGNIDNSSSDDFSNYTYPRQLFLGDFKALKYGVVEKDVYINSEKYPTTSITDEDIDKFFNTEELINIKEFIENIINQINQIDDYNLADRTRQDEVWKIAYTNKNHSMNNNEIIKEYIKRYI